MNFDSFAHDSQTLKALSVQLGYDGPALDQDGEAGRLWEALNELSNDPIAYQEFMAKQLQHLHSNKDGEVVLNRHSASSATPPFVPLTGFVVETFTRPEGAKLFLNLCHHETAVPKPLDGNGNAVATSQQNLENLQIPLLISKVRNCFDGSNKKALVVDVVVNSWCIDVGTKTPSFLTDLVELAMNSLKEDHSIEIEARGHSPWKIIKSEYKGGLGRNGSNPRPFEDSKEPKRVEVGPIAETPSDLLKCKEEQTESQSKVADLKISQAETAERETTKLIQEIGSDDPANKAKDGHSASGQSQKGSVLKSGFLNQCSGSKPIYSEEGSAGDGSTGTGGSYAKLMSRSKVVDLTASAQQAKASSDAEIDDHRNASGQDIVQTLKDLSNIMTDAALQPGVSSRCSGEESAPTTVNQKEVGNRDVENVAVTEDGERLVVRIDLSSCRPRIDGMKDLDLQMSEDSLELAAPRCRRRWRTELPHPVDVDSVSAKFRQRQQALEVACLRK